MIHSLPTVLFMQEEKTRNHAHFAENKKNKNVSFLCRYSQPKFENKYTYLKLYLKSPIFTKFKVYVK